MIKIKSQNEIKKIRLASKLASKVLEMIECYIKPGISTGDLDKICYEYIIFKQKAIPASLGYQGFPKSICTSVNEVVCHGIPDFNKKLKNGDIINIDISILKDGFYADTSKMFLVGNTKIIGQRLCKITKNCLNLAIKIIKPGIRLKLIGKTIQNFVESENFSVVREYCGHGIGKKFHEDPPILHFNTDDGGVILKEGMIFTIEPMINAGSKNISIMKDGWTVKTKDHCLSAQYEHTILVTSDGCEIMTLRSDDNLPRIIHHTIY